MLNNAKAHNKDMNFIQNYFAVVGVFGAIYSVDWIRWQQWCDDGLAWQPIEELIKEHIDAQ